VEPKIGESQRVKGENHEHAQQLERETLPPERVRQEKDRPERRPGEVDEEILQGAGGQVRTEGWRGLRGLGLGDGVVGADGEGSELSASGSRIGRRGLVRCYATLHDVVVTATVVIPPSSSTTSFFVHIKRQK
jgi:hypothetical protein